MRIPGPGNEKADLRDWKCILWDIKIRFLIHRNEKAGTFAFLGVKNNYEGRKCIFGDVKTRFFIPRNEKADLELKKQFE